MLDLYFGHSEPFNDDGTWRTDVFFNTLGESYVQIALNAARTADPNAKLYINDYNIEGPGAKATAMLNLVTSLKQQNVPLDGVGFQCHFIVGELPQGLAANWERFTALGLEMAVTELDIRMTLPSTPALLAQQKTDYNTVISACMSVDGCVGVTVWDWTDKYSWVPSTFSGQGAACPWDQVRVIWQLREECSLTMLLLLELRQEARVRRYCYCVPGVDAKQRRAPYVVLRRCKMAFMSLESSLFSSLYGSIGMQYTLVYNSCPTDSSASNQTVAPWYH